MSMELVWPYVATVSNPSVEGYLDWAANQNDELYKLKFQQVNNWKLSDVKTPAVNDWDGSNYSYGM